MAAGEIFLAAFLQVLLERLAPREILNNFGRLKGGLGKKLEEWRKTLYAIAEVLNDAEEKQLMDKGVELWLDDLEDLAHDVEDVLDKFSTEMLRRKAKEQNWAGTSKVRSLIPKLQPKFNMKSEVEKISLRLQEISERKDRLGLKYIGATSAKIGKRPPSSYALSGVPVVGRDDDKTKIVEFLSRDHERSMINFQVLAIVGMPGIGKTTLAQLVLNEDNDAMKQFSPKIWEYVSDEFNLVRVTKAILESVTSQPCHFEEFNSIQENLSKELEGKKFLLFLDDVWNTCDYELWEKLRLPFHYGAPGSKIIVTTRDAKVARIMGATEVYDLRCISNDNCWKVFEHHAFGVDNDILPTFGFLQDKIVARCSGLPLAARTLGGLLGSKEYDEWEEILNSKLWSLSNEESDILPVLRLSYYYLPSNLKRCFAYCSILPNGYEFGEMQLILLWMAEGFLQQPGERKEMEDIGGDYFGELVSRSLFQKSSKHNLSYVMHDLSSELARWAAGEICFRLEDKPEGRSSARTRHSSYIPGNYDGVKRFEALSEVKHLRTFLPMILSPIPHNYLTSKVTCDLLPNLQYLRVLSLNGYQITELPNSIAELSLLKYLDLSHTLIVSLPESISTLSKLQTLILDNCSQLKSLPSKMRNLTNLRHLSNLNVPSLDGMPSQLDQLANLQTLANFVVGKGSESSVREIGPMLLLRGTLRLSRLENVIDVVDARKTNLSSKEGLDALQLEWSGRKENEQVVLDMLRPHKNLIELTIKGYRGFQFSTWIGDPSFSNMVLVRLEGCNNCRYLPPLGQLFSLKELYVRGMSQVESVGVEFYGDGNLSFPLLETLEFEDMQQWKEWFPFGGDQGIGAFSRLKILSIKRCPKLEGRLPENLDSLAKLEINECGECLVSIANYKLLSTLDVFKCKVVVCSTTVQLELLKYVTLLNVSELRFQTEETGLRKVEELSVGNCVHPLFAWQYLISLRVLFVSTNSELLDLHHLTSLEQLEIYKCPSLVSIPESSLPPSLEIITIHMCDSLTHIAAYQMPRSLRTIKIRECNRLTLLFHEEEELESTFSSCSREEEEAFCLGNLEISGCSLLMSLSFRGKLMRTLKVLCLFDCDQLKSISHILQDNTCLECIDIRDCANLRTLQLPRGLKVLRVSTCKQLESIGASLHDDTRISCIEAIDIENCQNLKHLLGLRHLTDLDMFYVVNCRRLVPFQSRGLPITASKLRHIIFLDCRQFGVLPTSMCQHFISLQIMTINLCEDLAFILEEGLAPNLTVLNIFRSTDCKPLSMWGLKLNRLTSLKELWLNGGYADSSPVTPEEMEMLLPKSLIKLKIECFSNVRRLPGKILCSLTSLESLTIRSLNSLECIPKGLPLSLTHLDFYDCLGLSMRYEPSNAQDWARIAHIPFINMRESEPRSLRYLKCWKPIPVTSYVPGTN